LTLINVLLACKTNKELKIAMDVVVSRMPSVPLGGMSPLDTSGNPQQMMRNCGISLNGRCYSALIKLCSRDDLSL